MKNVVLFGGILTTSISLSLLAFSLVKSDGLLTAFGVNIGADFLAFYTGGTFFNQGILEQIYTLTPDFKFQEQLDYQRSLIGTNFKGHNPFLNPPFMAILYGPLAQLPYLTAFSLWLSVNFLLLCYAAMIIRKELETLQSYPRYMIIGCCFLFYPTFGWILYGQATPVILLLYCLCFVALRKQHDFRAGLYLGLLAFKPQLAIILALVLLYKWRWRALIGGSLSLSLCLAAGFIFAPEAMFTYLEVSPRFFEFLRMPKYPTWGIHSYFGFAPLLFDGFSPSLTNGFILLLSGGTVFLLWQLWKNIPWLENQRSWDLAMALTFIWGLLMSPHLFFYDLMLLLLPAAILFSHRNWLKKQDPTLTLWLFLTWLVCFLGKFHISLTKSFSEQYNFPEIYFQITTPVIFYLGYRLFKGVQRDAFSRHDKA